MNAARQNRICSRVLYWQCVKTFAELSTIRFCAKRDFPIAPDAEAAGALFGEVESTSGRKELLMKKILRALPSILAALTVVLSNMLFSLFTSNIFDYMALTRPMLMACLGITIGAAVLALIAILLGRLVAPTCSAAYGLAFWLKEVIRNWRYDRTLLDTHFIDYTIFKLLRVLAVLGVILWAAVCVMALVCILRRRCKKSSPEGA